MENLPNFHRILYLFFCKECVSPDSWICFRVLEPLEEDSKKEKNVKKKTKKQKKKQEDDNPFGNVDDWGCSSSWDDTNDTGDSGNTFDDLEELLKIRDLSLEEKNKPKVKKEPKKEIIDKDSKSNEKEGNVIFQSDIPSAWLSIADEPQERKEKGKSKKEESYDTSVDNDWKGEKYERVTVYSKSFSKFTKYLQRAPQQVLRYDFQGTPLWMTDKNIPSISSCICGSPRTFEFQIMPNGLNWIKENLITSKEGIMKIFGYGSIYIFSCTSCCTSNTFKNELVVYQETEDSIGPLKELTN